MQLGEASAEEAFRVRYFPMSLTGPAFQWFTWRELERKFHAHYFSGSTEKKLIDLTVDAKCAPSAKHIASRTSWLHTCRESRDVPVNFS
jgi:hypothetical protein